MIRQLSLLLCTAVVLFACSKGNNNSNTNNNSNPPTSNNITINNMAFNSASISVKQGTIITWTNNETATHTVTADDGSFTSGDMKQGDKYTHTFDAAGTFNYHCRYHSSMTGSVTVNQ